MADTITYPESSYGIMPNDAFNKYLRFSNQRRATTGIPASTSDKKAFWEGTMESVVKNSATRAAQNLDRKRYESDVALRTRQLDQADDARKTGAISSLAQYPMTYLMYDALGIGRKKGEKSLWGKGADAISNWYSGYGSSSGIPAPGYEAPVQAIPGMSNSISTDYLGDAGNIANLLDYSYGDVGGGALDAISSMSANTDTFSEFGSSIGETASTFDWSTDWLDF
jgi:hypothetical protein